MPSPITREALHARLTGRDRPVLVEALGAAFYADAHLPGAVNIPPGQVDRLAPGLLPDPAAEIVVYGSRSGTGPTAVARRLEELGYVAVAVYPGGKEDWVEHGLPLVRPAPPQAERQGHASTGALSGVGERRHQEESR